MLNNILMYLPRTANMKNKNQLIDALLLSKTKINRLKHQDDNLKDRVNVLIDALIDKLNTYKLSINQYMDLKKEIMNNDDDKLSRVIDTYIYILKQDNGIVENKTKIFIEENNLKFLEDRCVLIRYNETKPIIYKSYNRNIDYLSVFSFIRYIDSKYLSLANKIIEMYGFNIENINEIDGLYGEILCLFEKELGYLKNNDLTNKLYGIYKNDLIKYIKTYVYVRFRREKSNEETRKSEYFIIRSRGSELSKAKQKLKYDYTTMKRNDGY